MSGMGKAIGALLTGVLGVLAQFGIDVEWLTPEVIAGIQAIITTVVVYAVANK